MRIGFITSPFYKLPRNDHHSIPSLSSNMIITMANMGHHVVVYGNSKTNFDHKNINVIHVMDRMKYDRKNFLTQINTYFEKLLNHIDPALDVIQNQTEFDVSNFEVIINKEIGVPVVSYYCHIFKNTPKMNPEETYFVGMSKNQIKTNKNINFVDQIYHGINLDKFIYNEDKEDFFFYLGKIREHKGLHNVVNIIGDNKLKVAGSIQYKDYWDRFKHKFKKDNINYLGVVTGKPKLQLLSKSKALLMLIEWEEPFGLVVPEALASGTPVIATRRGSMSELIKDGYNGYLVDSIQEAKERLNDVHLINPKDCRESSKKFSIKRMCEDYLDLYERITKIK